ncbi:MAG: hypothetical protein Q9222_000328 [Ikaeria aurantiellina]
MYNSLARIEKQLADIELNCLRKTYIATRPKLLERAAAIKAVPDFWSTVIDEAPTEIDQRIQPRDVPALSCLISLDVERFEILDGEHGEPRSIKLSFTFKRNQWFHDETIEKRFYWRTSGNGWSGLVSDPVKIHWKDRDLTDGLLELAGNLWEKQEELKQTNGQDSDEIRATAEYMTLVEKVQRTPQDAISFFGLFGYRGLHISARQSLDAIQRQQHSAEGSEHWRDMEEELPPLPDTEIYPHGGDVAIAVSEDLYPGAIQYFSKLLIKLRSSELCLHVAAAAKERDAKISDGELGNTSSDSEERNSRNGEYHVPQPSKRSRLSG